MNKLKYLRKQLNISARELSNIVNITHSTITYLENGTRPFRQVHIDKLTAFFNVTSDYLLGRSETGYIVRPQYGDEELLLTESEYIRLSEYIQVSLINNNSINISIKGNLTEEDIVLPSKTVYRELKGSVGDYDMKDTLVLKVNDLLKKMTDDDIKKTIKFIEEYIFK